MEILKIVIICFILKLKEFSFLWPVVYKNTPEH